MAQPNRTRQLFDRLQVPVLVLLVTSASSTAGYHALWHDRGGTWLDAAYMTFITITTIGFGEVQPLGTEGRLLTMATAALGIGSLFYSFTVLLDFATSHEAREERRRRRMQQDIDALNGHTIVAGMGRVGREAVHEFADSKAPFVVIDPSEKGQKVAEEKGWFFIRGDASDDGVLERAGVRRARGLIVTTSDDATNLYVVLSARLLNPDLFIASRAADELSVPKLLRAGANRAISPYAIGGRRLAHLVLSPRVVDFLDTALKKGDKTLTIDEVVVLKDGQAVGRSLAQLDIARRSGAAVLAVLRENAPTPNPPGDFVLAAGDLLLALGTDEQLRALGTLIGGEGRGAGRVSPG